jgi:hypothetical protein
MVFHFILMKGALALKLGIDPPTTRNVRAGEEEHAVMRLLAHYRNNKKKK